MSTYRAVIVGAAILGLSPLARADGTIAGVVNWDGPAPQPVRIHRGADTNCRSREMIDPTILLGAGGKAVQNVYVRVSKNAPAREADLATFRVIDQVDCMYTPRVVGAIEGQKILIKNADGIVHNVHAYDGPKTWFNQAQTPGAPPIMKAAPAGISVVKLGCDLHPWMAGYVLISKHPFFAVTGKDGRFVIEGLPPGTYEIEAWHESLGTRTAAVTLESGKAATVSFSFKPRK